MVELVILTQTVFDGHHLSITTQNRLLSSHKTQLRCSVVVAPPPCQTHTICVRWPPYVLHQKEQAFILAQGTAKMFSCCCTSSHSVLPFASLFYDCPVELVKLTELVFNGHHLSSNTQNRLLSSHKTQLRCSVVFVPPPTLYFLLLIYF